MRNKATTTDQEPSLSARLTAPPDLQGKLTYIFKLILNMTSSETSIITVEESHWIRNKERMSKRYKYGPLVQKTEVRLINVSITLKQTQMSTCYSEILSLLSWRTGSLVLLTIHWTHNNLGQCHISKPEILLLSFLPKLHCRIYDDVLAAPHTDRCIWP